MENKVFKEIKGNFGFGCMRLPMNGEEVDIDQTCQMVDAFINAGLNYFDTAHGYINGKSETALKTCLTSRHDRSEYLLTDKLTASFFNTKEDIRPFFESQLEACGVDYFDFYLMHAQGASNYPKYKQCEAYQTAFELKKEGKIKHVGISFHDKPEVLDMILNENPDVEIVQIQFNYLDYNDESIKAKECMEVCEKHNKPVIVMEPVKGGALVNLPPKAQKVFDALNGGSNASYAIRFAASQKPMVMTLSGMSSLSQMEDNLSFMKDFKPLVEKEYDAINKVVEVFNEMNLIPCTGCKYCIEESHCPKGIVIPKLFSCKNTKEKFNDWNADYYYNLFTEDSNKASDCIGCGKCEKVCPQHLPIRELLKDVAKTFE